MLLRAFKLGYLAVLVSACSGPGFLKQRNDTLAAKPTASPAVIVTSETAGVTTGRFDVGAATAQTIAVSASSPISGASVTFQPGALAISADIVLQEGATLATSNTLADLGQAGNEVVDSAAAVLITGGETDAAVPFTLRLSLPSGTSLTTLQTEDIAVFFRVEQKADRRLVVGLTPASQLRFIDGFVETESLYFGSFQAVRLKTPAVKAVEAASSEPILAKSGVVVSTAPAATPTPTPRPTSTPVTPVETGEVTFTTPANNALINAAGVTVVNLVGQCSPVGVTITLAKGLTSLATAPCVSGQWAATISLSAFADGNVDLTAQTSLGGNTSSLTLIKDATSPTLSLTPSTTLTSAGITLSGSCTEPGRTIMLTAGALSNSTTCVSSAWNVAWDLSSLSDGAVSLQAALSDAAGNSTQATGTVTKDATPPTQPSAPIGPSSPHGSTSLTFTWSAGNDATSGIASYEIQIGTSAGASDVYEGSVNTTSKTVTGSQGQTYYARMRAIDLAGNISSWSANSSGVTIDLSAPTAGGSLTVAPLAPTSAALSWSAASDTTTAAALLLYRVYYSTVNNLSTVSSVVANGTAAGPATAGITSASVTGLTPETTYWFTVIVTDEAGNQSVYSPVTGTTGMVGPICHAGGAHAVASDGSSVYVGGSISLIGQCTGGGALINTTTGKLAANPAVAGKVNAVISDGSGGWYLGGLFSAVQGHAAGNLAHIGSDGLFDANFVANTNAEVYALNLSGAVLYVGGLFTSINATTRNYIAALNPTTGTLTAWNPNANNSVRAIAISGSTVYLGGSFTYIASQTRNRLAAIDTAGTLQSWSPSADGPVYAIATNGSTIYVGGNFSSINSASRLYMAALNTSANLVTCPMTDGFVYALLLNGSTLYVGGDFDHIGSEWHINIGAVNTTSGVEISGFVPDTMGEVRGLAISGSTLYVGGYYGLIGPNSDERRNIAAVDSTTGAISSWNPGAGDKVNAVAVSGSTVFLGGDFTTAAGSPRNNLYALDLAGNARSWNPGTDGTVSSLAVANGKVYVGGSFTTLAGVSHNKLGAVDAFTGVDSGAALDTDGNVTALETNGTKVYVGGNFTVINGQSRSNLASVFTTSNAVTAWNPLVNGPVATLKLAGGTLYAGGTFSQVGGVAHTYIAAFNPSSDAALSWAPTLDGDVSTLTASGDTLYAGGNFFDIDGQTRIFAAAFALSNGALTSWDVGSDGPIYALAYYGSKVFMAGDFSALGGGAASGLAPVDATTGTLVGGAVPSVNVSPLAMSTYGTSIFIAGPSMVAGLWPRTVLSVDLTTGNPIW